MHSRNKQKIHYTIIILSDNIFPSVYCLTLQPKSRLLIKLNLMGLSSILHSDQNTCTRVISASMRKLYFLPGIGFFGFSFTIFITVFLEFSHISVTYIVG